VMRKIVQAFPLRVFVRYVGFVLATESIVRLDDRQISRSDISYEKHQMSLQTIPWGLQSRPHGGENGLRSRSWLYLVNATNEGMQERRDIQGDKDIIGKQSPRYER
jgi:hypothetical protein